MQPPSLTFWCFLGIIASTFILQSAAGIDSQQPFALLSTRTYEPATFVEHTAANPRVWLGIFRRDTASFAKRASEQDPVRAAAFATSFERLLRELELQIEDGKGLNCIALCRLREEFLRAAGFRDIFKGIKEKENTEALRILPSVLQYLDDEDAKKSKKNDSNKESDRTPQNCASKQVQEQEHSKAVSLQHAHARLRNAMFGVFAGNIFDLGAEASIKHFEKEESDCSADVPPAGFVATSRWVRQRSLAVDDMQKFLDRAITYDSKSKKACLQYRKIMIFVDNCGADLVCGILPLVREFLRLSPTTEIVLCANEAPAINDITAEELEGILNSLDSNLFCDHNEGVEQDCTDSSKLEDLKEDDKNEGLSLLASAVDCGRLRVVSSGNDMPVIDLRRVGKALNAEATSPSGKCDLVLLEGMGRAIETNLHAMLTVDCLNLGMVRIGTLFFEFRLFFLSFDLFLAKLAKRIKIKHAEVAGLLGGLLYDSVCCFKPAIGTSPIARNGSMKLHPSE